MKRIFFLLFIFVGFTAKTEITLDECGKPDRLGKTVGHWLVGYDGFKKCVIFNNKKIPEDSLTDAEYFVENSNELLSWEFEKVIKNHIYKNHMQTSVFYNQFNWYLKKYKLKKEALDLVYYMAIKPPDVIVYPSGETTSILLNNGLYGCELLYKINSKNPALVKYAFLFSKYNALLAAEQEKVPQEIIDELPNISSANDVEFLLKIKNSPEYYADLLLDGNLLNDKNFMPFLILISNFDSLPQKYCKFLKERFLQNIKNKANQDENIIILELLSKKAPQYAVEILPGIIDCVSAFQSYSEAFLLYYMRISGAPDGFLANFQSKIDWKSVKTDNVVIAYGKIKGDLNKAMPFIEEVRKELNRAGASNYANNQLVKFVKQSGLTVENRKLIWSRMQPIWGDTRMRLDKENIPAIQNEMKNGPRYEFAYNIIQSSFELEDMPLDLQKKFKADLKMFVENLRSDDPKVRIKGISFINNKNRPVDRDTFVKVLPFLDDPDDTVASSVARLAERDSPKYFPEILQLLKSDDPFVVCSACKFIEGMSLLGLPAVPELESILKDNGEWTVKVAAIHALGNIGSRASCNLIETFKEDKNKNIAHAANNALLMLKGIEP